MICIIVSVYKKIASKKKNIHYININTGMSVIQQFFYDKLRYEYHKVNLYKYHSSAQQSLEILSKKKLIKKIVLTNAG